MGAAALILLRGLHVAAMLSAFGGIVAILFVARPVLAGAGVGPSRLVRRVAALVTASVLAALVTCGLWLAAITASIAGATTPGEMLAALPVVALHTRAGHLLLARGALLLAALVLTPARPSRAGAAVLAALLLQPLIGHAGAVGSAWLTGAEMLHLTAVGAWLGGLAPLLVLVAALPAGAARRAADHFTPIGLSAVVVIAGTGIAQASVLIGSLHGLVATGYGRAALVKIALFVALLALAALNRLVLIGRLARGRGALLASLTLETALGLCVVLAAAALAQQPPSIDRLG